MKKAIPITLTKDSYILFDVHQCTPEQVLQYLIDHARPELVDNGDKAARNILLFLMVYREQLKAAAGDLGASPSIAEPTLLRSKADSQP